jgi:putative pyruvate formate lyase activating enzyme
MNQELALRAERLYARLADCDICPRNCRVDRLNGETGFCRSGVLPVVDSFCDHHGEEPAVSGSRGSGTVFFGNCNLRCVYCQNYQISQPPQPRRSGEVSCKELAGDMLYLQDVLKCHNINLVSPSHFVPQIIGAVLEAVPMGLHLPLVYNSNGYDSLETLKELDGIIDIYMPDFKYIGDKEAAEFSMQETTPGMPGMLSGKCTARSGILPLTARAWRSAGVLSVIYSCLTIWPGAGMF